MNSAFYLSRVPALKMTALGALSLFCLSSCFDKEDGDKKPAEQPTATPSPADGDALAQAREALFNEALYELANKVTDPAIFPDLNEEVKVLLEQMETYYAELAKGPKGTMERTRLSLQIASTLMNLNSGKAFDAYTTAQNELKSMPEAIRDSDDGKHCASDIENGLGACLLAQRKPLEAMPHFEAALAIAEAQFEAVAPAEGAEVPQGEVAPDLSRKATDVLDCLRCLGDCQMLAEDPEEARATYLRGQEVVTRLKVLSSSMSISYVKLLRALGNLENAGGRPKEALAAWATGAQICKQLNNSSPRLDVKAQTLRCYNTLIPAIQAVANSVNAAAAQEPAADKEAEADIQTEPITPELKAAAEAAANPPAAPVVAPESVMPDAVVPAAAPAPAPASGKHGKPGNKRKRR